MITQKKINKNPWRYFYRFTERRLAFLQIGANMAGAGIVTCYFVFFDEAIAVEELKTTFTVIGIMFVALVILAMAVLRNWQKDLERFVRLKARDRQIDSQLHRKAQRKILDLPFISSMMSLFNWFLAAITMSVYICLTSEAEETFKAMLFDASRTLIGVIIAGFVTCAIVFFSVEVFCRRIWPYFFPDGGMLKAPCTFRLKLPIRMLIIFVLTSILPIILMAVLSYNKAKMMLVLNPQDVIESLLYLTAFLLATALVVAIILSHLFSTAIVRPVSRMEEAMTKVEIGDLTVSVPVENNDELGTLAEHFNQMTEGLKERYRLRRALDLAREVQQNLLPKENPVVNGLDIAGTSIYCDETGGDYFDFLENNELGQHRLGVVIGDVSEHGIPSALLMATARGFLRQRSALPGSIASVVSDVNRQLTRDVEETGRFMTLFYLLMDLPKRSLHWVRAGHDAAILYDPTLDRFEELNGEGIALGVNKDWQYQEYEKTGLADGQIIVLSTDGIWEAQNPQGDMFGKAPIYEIIRRNSSASAQKLIDIFIAELDRFQQSRQPADDITLVVVKLKDNL